MDKVRPISSAKQTKNYNNKLKTNTFKSLAADKHSEIVNAHKRTPDYFQTVDLKASKAKIYSEGAEAFKLKPKAKCEDPQVHARISATINEWITFSKLSETMPDHIVTAPEKTAKK